MARIRRRFGRITASLEPADARLLRTLVTDVRQLLLDRDAEVRGASADPSDDPGVIESEAPRDPLADLVGMDLSWDDAAASVSKPTDPALARLLPDAYVGGDADGESAAEFRAMTEADLRQGKLSAAQILLESLPEEGGSIRLDDDTAQAWLAALNDVRLTLGTRLDVTDDTDFDIDPADPANRLLTVYLWLGALQQQLVDAVTGYTSPY